MAKTVKPIANILRPDEYSSFAVGWFTRSRWFPIGLILSNSVLSTCAEVLLKIGVTHPLEIAFPAPIAFISAIFNYWVLMGIFAYVGSLSLWLTALPRLPLHVAYGLSSTVHLLVPFACWLVLHESIPMGRLLGMAFILTGTFILGSSHEQSPTG
jgi:multidrug transporter EmrE-like cation transporter